MVKHIKKFWGWVKSKFKKETAPPLQTVIPETDAVVDTEPVVAIPHHFSSRNYSVSATKTRPLGWGTMSSRRYGSFASKSNIVLKRGLQRMRLNDLGFGL